MGGGQYTGEDGKVTEVSLYAAATCQTFKDHTNAQLSRRLQWIFYLKHGINVETNWPAASSGPKQCGDMLRVSSVAFTSDNTLTIGSQRVLTTGESPVP